MGLKELATNLSSYRINNPSKGIDYSDDHHHPLVKRVEWDVTDQNASPTFLGGGENHWNDNVTDVALRGGLKANLSRRKIDFERFTNWGKTSQGQQFLIRQVGLQKMNPKINAPMEGIFGSSPANQRTYLGASTLASIEIAGAGNIKREGATLGFIGNGYEDDKSFLFPFGTRFGEDFVSSFIDKTTEVGEGESPLGLHSGNLYLQNHISAYPDRYKDHDQDGGIKFDKNGNPKHKNRLLWLYQNKIKIGVEDDDGNNAQKSGKALGALSDLANFFQGGKGEPLYDYIGGPDSILGIGNTAIRRYTNSNPEGHMTDFISSTAGSVYDNLTGGVFNFTHQKSKPGTWKALGWYSGRSGVASPSNKVRGGEGIERAAKSSRSHQVTFPGMQSKEGIHWKSDTDRLNGLMVYNAPVGTAYVDRINYVGIIKEEAAGSVKLDDWVSDFVDFNFKVIDQDDFHNPYKLHFKALLESINDDYGATHNEVKYNGRGESFYTYNTFKRKINLQFKIAAQSRMEMQPIYRKLNFLVAQTAPNYSTFGRIRTPYTHLKVGDWIDDVPGIINNITLAWEKDYSWEIKANAEQDRDMKVLPHVLDVSLSFTPIHNFSPNNSYKTPFIGIADWANKNPINNKEGDPIYQSYVTSGDQRHHADISEDWIAPNTNPITEKAAEETKEKKKKKKDNKGEKATKSGKTPRYLSGNFLLGPKR